MTPHVLKTLNIINTFVGYKLHVPFALEMDGEVPSASEWVTVVEKNLDKVVANADLNISGISTLQTATDVISFSSGDGTPLTLSVLFELANEDTGLMNSYTEHASSFFSVLRVAIEEGTVNYIDYQSYIREHLAVFNTRTINYGRRTYQLVVKGDRFSVVTKPETVISLEGLVDGFSVVPTETVLLPLLDLDTEALCKSLFHDLLHLLLQELGKDDVSNTSCVFYTNVLTDLVYFVTTLKSIHTHVAKGYNTVITYTTKS